MFLKKYKKIIISVLFMVVFLLIAAQGVLADVSDTTGLNKTAQTGYSMNADQLSKNSDIPTIIGRVIGTILSFLGVVFFGIILYAGIGWITSMGKEEKINEAKEMIIAAVLGLIVVLGAYAITNVVAQIFAPTTGVSTEVQPK